MKETFQSFEKPKPVSNEIIDEQKFEGDETWLRQQIKELTDVQDEGRQAQLKDARQKSFESIFNQANYMKDALTLALEPEQLAKFGGFFSALRSLEEQK